MNNMNNMNNMMKHFLFVAFAIILLSCSKDDETDETPLIADFEISVVGESPNAQITLSNLSKGAESYLWTFGEGVNIESSVDKTPVDLRVDKLGELKVTLAAINGSNQDEVTKTISISGSNAILSYTDIEFGLDADSDIYGRLFSFETGKIYKDSEISEDNGSDIHLAFSGLPSFYYFESPTASGYNVPNATLTKVINWEMTPSISTNDFDQMTDDSGLKGLIITETNDSFGDSSIPGTVLFELADGKKGVIKTEEVNSERILVDIKIQKYN